MLFECSLQAPSTTKPKAMLRSFLTIALRILWRNKVTSFINIAGLSLGITAFIFILMYIYHETSYDKFNVHYENIYRLEIDNFARIPPSIGPLVRDRIPEVKHVVRLAGGYIEATVTYFPNKDPDNFKQASGTHFWADSTVFNVFTFPLVRGDLREALKGPFKVVLSETMAKKLFDDADPMMKVIEYQNHSFTVSGIINDVRNSHLQVDILLSQESLSKVYPERNLDNATANAWLWSATYLLMSEKLDVPHIEKKINDALQEIKDVNRFNLEFHQFRLRALKDIYFSGAMQNLDYSTHGNWKLIQVLFVVALVIVLLACINYVNLTTAKASLRAREVGVKMVVGSSGMLLRGQLILESMLFTITSFLIAITLVQIFLSPFNLLAGTDLRLTNLYTLRNLLIFLIGASALGMLTGIYPALYLTTVRPVNLMRGELSRESGSAPLRTGLMSFQFAISVIMIIGTLACLQQLNYIRTMNPGFNKEQVLTIETPADFPEEFALRETFKKKLLLHPQIKQVAYSVGHPSYDIPTAVLESNDLKRTSGFIVSDPDYIDLMNIKVVDGRNFSWDIEGKRIMWGDASQFAVLLNETAVEEFGIESPVGKSIKWIFSENQAWNCFIVGVVKDFHFRSLHHKIEPLVLGCGGPWYLCNIKISQKHIPATLKMIEGVWKTVYGIKPFKYRFLDDRLDQQYKSDEQTAKVIAYFAGIAILLACLGLFALSSFMISRRTKEIGIRKSMGASIKNIFVLLSWDFLKWIGVSSVIAVPIAWYLMELWLDGFAYHIKLGADIFITSMLVSIAIALLTITWQSLKAANINPARTLQLNE
jgi:putative ABC transport system permease protein